MKKTLFLAVLAGAALAGCVKNEPIAAPGDGSPARITFDAPVVSNPTRATEYLGNFPKAQNFAVYALYHDNEFIDSNSAVVGTSYMSNVVCSCNNGTESGNDPNLYWTTATPYYWPKNGYLTFAGYTPVMSTEVSATGPYVEWGANGFKFHNFKVNDDPTKQIDLLYSNCVYNQNKGTMVTDAPYDGVTIPFKHALSSILFTAKAEAAYEGTEIRLISIKIDNVINKATFTQGLAGNYVQDQNANSGTWDTSAGQYKDGGYEVYKYVVPTDGVDEKGLLLSTSEVYVNGANGQDENEPSNPNEIIPGDDGTRRSDLILIPQNLDTEGHKVTVTITYSIKSATGEAVDNTSTFGLAVGQDEANAMYKWEKGKRYTYHISIGLQQIYFNPQVENWTDEPGILIDPNNPAETPVTPEAPAA